MKKFERLLREKYADKRDPYRYDRGRDIVFIRKEVQTVRIILTKQSTCFTCDNGGIGYVRPIKINGKEVKVCNDCYASIIRSRILNG